MSEIIEYPRQFCTLAAQQTIVAIDRAIPILHAGPGCSSKIFGGASFSSGYQGSGYVGGSAIPCTNTTERDVVFGGEERLREVIDGALKVMDGDFFVVLTGCTSDIVGDDVAQVVSEFTNRDVPIAYAETGGFKGNSYNGHELVLESIINQTIEDAGERIEGLVNIWSVVPYQDPFWDGNLQAIKRLLEGIGLKANILFGEKSGGFKSWKQIPSAQFNLVISPWVGVKIAELLESKFGTPWLQYPSIPIGAVETSKFLKAVGRFANIDEKIVDEYIKEQESSYYYYLEKAADFLLEFRYGLPGRFFNIADSFYTIGISKFLANDLSLLPGHQFITDEAPNEYRSLIEEQLLKLAPGVSTEVSFIADGGKIHEKLRQYGNRYSPLIIGGTWDSDLAKELDGYHLSISLPITDRLILNRHYVGYDGGLRLTEDIYSSILQSYQ
ncbi:nitrogenase molybdenum-iron protein beta subunit NifK [Gottschalkia purinilytica]|uniref:Nitrogenase molybdenum-iron protein beta subunit NifK n=1 Tax=Gottschalkia purinilytica TaxID=1503 RepID=A0A0L0WAV4_GOTPU|nr:nitrogenase molybdenum-iron protein beta subunit NifK [Gottschalkia purinilytica]